MVDTLTVHLSRNELHEVEPASPDFETDGTFVIEFVNHGRAAHVHVHPDDALARGVAVTEPNIYVETDTARRVEVTVPDGPRPLRGSLDVSAGYGANEASIDVGLVSSPEPDLPVDETLAEPSGDAAEGTLSLSRLIDEDGLPVLALALVALVVAVGAAFVIGDVVVAAGALVVLVGVAAAVLTLAAE